MKHVRFTGWGWGKPSKTSKYHWFEGGRPICNCYRIEMPYLECYVISKNDWGALRCINCTQSLPSEFYKESKQIEYLRSRLREENVLLY